MSAFIRSRLTRRSAALGLVAATATISTASAQMNMQMPMQHQHGAAPADASASTKAFMDANAKMHRDMAIKFSGDADIDFVKGMIPHHQGAIDMANVVLKHGKDPAIRKLAEDIVKAQEGEIAMMRAWLKSRGQ
jgi:uncharacterized protein (DUF305 family)